MAETARDVLRLGGEKESHVRPPDGGDSDVSVMLAAVREEIRNAVAANKQQEVSRTLRELSAEWLPRKLRTIVAPRTFAGRVENWILPLLGEHTSATLKKKTVEAFLLDLHQKHGLSPQTVNHVRDAGRQLVDDALDNDAWFGGNPFAKAKQLKNPNVRREVLSRDEAARLLLNIPARWLPLFAVALYLGPRRKTLFNIRTEDVDIEHGVIHFRDTKTRRPVLDIPIPDELVPHLRQALEQSRGPWLFVTRFGEKFTGNAKALNRVLACALKGAGICSADGVTVRALTFRGLRRCSSTLHQEAGCHPWVVSKALGHSQASLSLPENMTAKKYTVFSPEFVRQELNKLTLR